MVNESMPAGSYDPAMCMSMDGMSGNDSCTTEWMNELEGKGRKFYNIVSHKIGLLDVRIGELQ